MIKFYICIIVIYMFAVTGSVDALACESSSNHYCHDCLDDKYAEYMYYDYETEDDSEYISDEDMIMCTQDAKICPNGKVVGRVGKNCEFAPCDDSDEISEEKQK